MSRMSELLLLNEDLRSKPKSTNIPYMRSGFSFQVIQYDSKVEALLNSHKAERDRESSSEFLPAPKAKLATSSSCF